MCIPGNPSPSKTPNLRGSPSGSLMYQTLPSTLPLYRATSRKTKWGQVLTGEGSHFTNGGRFNFIGQPAIYASDDPIVAISELAFYQAKTWQGKIGETRSPSGSTFPLVSGHRLWCFSLISATQIVDLLDDNSKINFSFSRLPLVNCGQAYGGTRELANDIRAYPDPKKPVALGLRAPSVRSLGSHMVPTQIVLFPRPGAHSATKIERCELTIEFLDDQANPARPDSQDIAWDRPRFRIEPGIGLATLLSDCRGGNPIPRGVWESITIRFV